MIKELYDEVALYVKKEYSDYEVQAEFDESDMLKAYKNGENHFSYHESHTELYNETIEEILSKVKENFKKTFKEKGLDIDDCTDELRECIDSNTQIVIHETCEKARFYVLPYVKSENFIFHNDIEFKYYFEDEDRNKELMCILDKLQINPKEFAQTFLDNYNVSDDFEINWDWFPDIKRNPYVNVSDLIDEMNQCTTDGYLTAFTTTKTIETFFHENEYIKLPKGTKLCIFNDIEGGGSIANLKLIRDWYVKRKDAEVRIKEELDYSPEEVYGKLYDDSFTEFSCF